MAFFTSIFRNLKNGGIVRKKDGGEVPEKPGFSFSRLFKEALSKNSFSPLPKAPIRMKKEGGVVEARTPFQQALHDNFLRIAGGGGIHRNIQRKAPIPKKKGGRIPKKSKTKKQKK